MAIYRGPGGAGDANSDITINLVTELTQDAEAAQAAAASSASDAASSAAAALTSENNASPVNAIVSEITTVAGISADVTTVAGIDSDVTTVSGNNANVTTVAGITSDVTTVATNNTNVTTVATNIANVNTTATNITNVNTVAGISSDVTAVVADATDIGTVATDLAGSDTIGTVATNIANVNTVAGISSDVTAVVADQADIGTVATNIANVNTVAGVSADVTTVAGINADVTSVAADATDIGTVATNIANVNTVATNNANVTTVATNIADVQAAATNIADIQAVADEVAKVITVANDLNEATSEIDTVAASIANVDAVGTNIASVNNVSANIDSVNNFGDTYFVSATEPSSPTEGDLWFDTTAQVMKVYTTSGFANAGSSVNGTSERQNYVVGTSSGTYTGSTTVFPATYDAGYVDVYLNGVKLVVGTDFTATNGTDITLTSAATSGDAVNIIGYGTFQLANFSINDANDVNLSGITNGQVLAYNSTSGDLEPTTIISDVVGDATPQLGGNLDLNSNDITGTGNIDVTGTVTADGLTVDGNVDVQSHAIDMGDNTTSVPIFTYNTNPTTSGATIGQTAYEWNGTKVVAIEGKSGDDTTNKDNGVFQIRVAESGNLNSGGLFVLDHNGNAGIGTSSPTAPLHIYSSSANRPLIESNSTAQAGLILKNTDREFRILNGSSSLSVYDSTSGSEAMRIDSSGNLLVGKTTTVGAFNTVGTELRSTGLVQSTVDSAKCLDLNRKTTTGEIIGFNYNGTAEGSVSITASGVTYNTTSDARLKTDIQPIADATDRLMQMNPVSHKWVADPEADAVVGFIAQEMQGIVPEAVSGDADSDEMMSMDYGRITPVLVAALQEATKEIQELKARVAELEAK